LANPSLNAQTDSCLIPVKWAMISTEPVALFARDQVTSTTDFSTSASSNLQQLRKSDIKIGKNLKISHDLLL